MKLRLPVIVLFTFLIACSSDPDRAQMLKDRKTLSVLNIKSSTATLKDAQKISRKIKDTQMRVEASPGWRLGLLSDTHTIVFLGPVGRRWRLTLMGPNGEILGKWWREEMEELQKFYIGELKYEWCLSNIHWMCGNVPHHF